LHANSLSTARISGPVSVECNVRSIGHLRDIVKLSTQFLNDVNAHRRLIAVSHATRDFHIPQGLAANKCVVVHNGVDLSRFCPRQPTGYLHRELNLPSNSRLIATIGQLGLRKGTDVTLTAALQIAKQFHDHDIHWLVVGERTSSKVEAQDFEMRLLSIAADKELDSRVHFLNSRADVPALLSECELLVHSARQEPLGRVLLEAAASGLAIVATNVGGTREIFPNNCDAAVLVPPDDACALSQAIRGLLLDDHRRHQLGANARKRAESAFDIQSAAISLINQYQGALV